MIQCSCTKGACPVCVRASAKPEAREEILSQRISHWHALLLLLSVLKMVLQKQTCKLGHGAKGMESRVSDS